MSAAVIWAALGLNQKAQQEANSNGDGGGQPRRTSTEAEWRAEYQERKAEAYRLEQEAYALLRKAHELRAYNEANRPPPY